MGMSGYIMDIQDKAAEDFVEAKITEAEFRKILESTGLDWDTVDGWVETATAQREKAVNKITGKWER